MPAIIGYDYVPHGNGIDIVPKFAPAPPADGTKKVAPVKPLMSLDPERNGPLTDSEIFGFPKSNITYSTAAPMTGPVPPNPEYPDYIGPGTGIDPALLPPTMPPTP